MSEWWIEFKRWSFWAHSRIPAKDRFQFLADMFSVVQAVLDGFTGFPGFKNILKSPGKIIRWAILNPDPLHNARVAAAAMKTRWATVIAKGEQP